MKLFSKIFSCLTLSILLFTLSAKITLAADISISPEAPDSDDKIVTVTVTGLEVGKQYLFCARSSDRACQQGVYESFNKFTANQSTMSFPVCADGDEATRRCPGDNYKAGTAYFFKILDGNTSIARVGFTVTLPGGGDVDIDRARGENPCATNKCDTALGSIPTNPDDFANKILSIAISIGGGIAFILMVIGSIRVLTSSGDQQKLAGGRDQIVAAITGILFIIFSVIILRFIGIDILGL